MTEQKSKQTGDLTERLWFGILLAMSGGLMDAYTYLQRGHVYANAQTGNILLFAVNLSEGNWQMMWNSLCPVLAFSIGITISFFLEYRMRNRETRLLWKRLVLLLEISVLLFVSFFPENFNRAANALVSLACGAQVEAFRVLNGSHVATTMCIGNLRNAIDFGWKYATGKEKENRTKMFLYLAAIGTFMIGAVVGGFLVRAVGNYAIIGSSVILLVAFFLSFLGEA